MFRAKSIIGYTSANTSGSMYIVSTNRIALTVSLNLSRLKYPMIVRKKNAVLQAKNAVDTRNIVIETYRELLGRCLATDSLGYVLRKKRTWSTMQMSINTGISKKTAHKPQT